MHKHVEPRNEGSTHQCFHCGEQQLSVTHTDLLQWDGMGCDWIWWRLHLLCYTLLKWHYLWRAKATVSTSCLELASFLRGGWDNVEITSLWSRASLDKNILSRVFAFSEKEQRAVTHSEVFNSTSPKGQRHETLPTIILPMLWCGVKVSAAEFRAAATTCCHFCFIKITEDNLFLLLTLMTKQTGCLMLV